DLLHALLLGEADELRLELTGDLLAQQVELHPVGVRVELGLPRLLRSLEQLERDRVPLLAGLVRRRDVDFDPPDGRGLVDGLLAALAPGQSPLRQWSSAPHVPLLAS